MKLTREDEIQMDAAIETLSRLHKQLNTETHECPSCHHIRANNWDHTQASQALDTAILRIYKAKNLLKLSDDKAYHGVETGAELQESIQAEEQAKAQMELKQGGNR